MDSPAEPAPLPRSPPPQDDLDVELAELFDSAPSSPACVPPSPERVSAPPAAPTRTILSVLAEKREKLSGTAAAIAAEMAAAASLTSSTAPSRPHIKEAMMIRRASKRAPSEAVAQREAEKRRRKARNAFKVVGRERKDEAKQTFEFMDSRFCNMPLREARFPMEAMTALFENCVRVDIAEITKLDDEMRAGKLGEYVVFGCLVKKHSKKETKTGAKYAVWSVCNMPRGKLPGGDAQPPPTVVTVLLFEDAFQAFHTQVEGSVFALRKPQLLPPRGSESARNDVRGNVAWSGHCLKVSKRDFVIPLGICKDFKVCEVEGPNSVCGVWYDANRMKNCPYHMRKKHRKLLNGSRMDVNNAERPGITGDATKHLQGPEDISKQQSEWGSRHGDEEKDDVSEDLKFKRNADQNMTKKLLASKRLAPPSLTEGFLKSDLLSRRKKRIDPLRKHPLPLASTRRGMFVQSSGTKDKPQNAGSLQEQYLQAVSVLCRCGFILGEDGSLSPPIRGGLKVKLRTSRDESADRWNLGSASAAVKMCAEKSSTHVEADASFDAPSVLPGDTNTKEMAGVGNHVGKKAVHGHTAAVPNNGAENCKKLTPSPTVRANQTSGVPLKTGLLDSFATRERSPMREEPGNAPLSSLKIGTAYSDGGTRNEAILALKSTEEVSKMTIVLDEESDSDDGT